MAKTHIDGGITRKQILTINGTLPNLNDYTAACRGQSWYKGAKMKEAAEKKITGYIKQSGLIPMQGAVEVNFRWIEPNRKRDLDNICFAKKFILDALVANNILECDGWRGVIGFTDTFEVDAANPRIEVTICTV